MKAMKAVPVYAISYRKRITEMSDGEYMRYKRRRAAAYKRRKMLLSAVLIFVLIIVISLFAKAIGSNAASVDTSDKCKYYRTEMIRFDKGIEEIAEECFDPEYFDSVEDIVKEIRKINHISADSAVPGGYIVYVPYYGDIH